MYKISQKKIAQEPKYVNFEHSLLVQLLSQDKNKLQTTKREEKPHFRKVSFYEVLLIKGHY